MEMKYKYIGIEDRMAKFIEKEQMKDREMWKIVSDQFIGFPDSGDFGWRGEYWGKLMRGACMIYQYTRDEELYEILTETTKDMLSHREESGRISTYCGNPEFTGWDMWCRKYVLLGFLHFYEICRDDVLKKSIVSAMRGHIDYIMDHIGEGKINICDTSVVWQGVNSASILEPVVMLYNITGDARYMEFADHIVKTGGAKEYNIFEAAYENKCKPRDWTVKKAYEIMSCFEGLIEYYKVTKEEKWKTSAVNFAKQLIDSEITIIGCAGCEHECFNDSALMQTYSKYDGLMQETCVTVTWMKLCYKLLCLTGDSIYADEIEKSCYNALYGAVNTEYSTNDENTKFDLSWFRDVYKLHTKKYGAQVFDSYSPLRLGSRGRAIGGYRPMRDNSVYGGCCIAIGAAGVALVPLMSVMAGEDVTFNLYPAGTVEADGFKATISTNYPAEGNVKITIDSIEKRCVKLRIPQFAKEFSIKLNGDDCSYTMVGGYAVVENAKGGDVIELGFDMNFRTIWGMENPEDEESRNHIAFIYGPLVLARDARLSAVGSAVDTGDISIEKIENTKFDNICTFEVKTGEDVLTMVDYASAGKVWGTEFEAWIKAKRG